MESKGVISAGRSPEQLSKQANGNWLNWLQMPRQTTSGEKSEDFDWKARVFDSLTPAGFDFCAGQDHTDC